MKFKDLEENKYFIFASDSKLDVVPLYMKTSSNSYCYVFHDYDLTFSDDEEVSNLNTKVIQISL